MKTLLKTLFILIILLILTDQTKAEITIKMTNPENGTVYGPCASVPITADVQTTGEEIYDLRFYRSGVLLGRLREAPWEYIWEKAPTGNFEISARVADADRNYYYSDTVKVKIGYISTADRIINGSFSCGQLAPWTLQNYEGAISTIELYNDGYFDDDYYVFIDIENGSSADWHIQLQQTFPTDSNHVYEIYFEADAEDTKTIAVGMQESQDPYNSQIWTNVEIDGPNEYGPIEFTSNRNDPTNLFKFCPGGNNIPFYIDNIRVIDLSATSVKQKLLPFGQKPSEYELFQAFPNPFNMNTTIQYQLSQPATVSLDIYNVFGQKIKTLVKSRQNDGKHTVKWNGTNEKDNIVPSGIYFYRLVIGTAGKDIELSGKVMLLK